jgi:hypothetical protein
LNGTMNRILILAVAALAAAAGLAPAQVIAYDPINQPLGQFNGFASSGAGATWPSANTWQPFGGNGGVVSPGSLTYGPLQTAGSHVDFHRFDVATGSIRSMGSNQGGVPKDLWFSILINPGANDQGMALYNGTTTEELFVGTPSGLTNYGLRVDGGFTGGASQTLSVNPTVAADGQTHFFVLHLTLTASVPSTATLFVDPDVSSFGNGTAPTGGSTVSFTGGFSFPFESLALGNAGPVGTTVSFDEFRMGTTWASVSPVPEPSALLLAGSGFAAFLVRQRRSYWPARA